MTMVLRCFCLLQMHTCIPSRLVCLLAGTEEADLQLQELQLQEAALASSHVRISLHAQHAQLDLNRADLAAICHLRDSFAAWQAQMSAEALYEDAYLGGDSFGGQLPVPASQVTFQLEACVHAQLHAPSQVSHFHIHMILTWASFHIPKRSLPAGKRKQSHSAGSSPTAAAVL